MPVSAEKNLKSSGSDSERATLRPMEPMSLSRPAPPSPGSLYAFSCLRFCTKSHSWMPMLRPSVAIAGRHATFEPTLPISSPMMAVSCGTRPPFSLQTDCATCHHWSK